MSTTMNKKQKREAAKAEKQAKIDAANAANTQAATEEVAPAANEVVAKDATVSVSKKSHKGKKTETTVEVAPVATMTTVTEVPAPKVKKIDNFYNLSEDLMNKIVFMPLPNKFAFANKSMTEQVINANKHLIDASSPDVDLLYAIVVTALQASKAWVTPNEKYPIARWKPAIVKQINRILGIVPAPVAVDPNAPKRAAGRPKKAATEATAPEMPAVTVVAPAPEVVATEAAASVEHIEAGV